MCRQMPCRDKSEFIAVSPLCCIAIPFKDSNKFKSLVSWRDDIKSPIILSTSDEAYLCVFISQIRFNDKSPNLWIELKAISLNRTLNRSIIQQICCRDFPPEFMFSNIMKQVLIVLERDRKMMFYRLTRANSRKKEQA